jgi:hypothetical protein
MPTGQDLLDKAAEKIGQKYVYGANVDIFDPSWSTSWDCAEFCTWVAYQVTRAIYGCVDNDDANDLEPYTGGWRKDVKRGTVIGISVAKATKIPGAILLRYREGGKHIVFSCGDGTTIEAKSARYGVCRGKVGNLSSWDFGILLPGVQYKEV